MITRADRDPIANWWWTIDRSIFAACLILMGIGIMLSFAASPTIAKKIGIADSFYFVRWHIIFSIPAFFVMVTISFFSLRNIRRLCALLLIVTLVLMVATLFWGPELKGARRWIPLFGISVQASEFMKPAFVVISAWLFSEQVGRKGIPGHTLATILYVFCSVLLVLQPDIGQTLLMSATWGGLFFVAGMPLSIILLFLILGVLGSVLAYLFLHHVRERIDGFLTGEGNTFQVDVGREAILNGGWFGRGPGEGTVKRIIPDSHTDFVFSVAAEEYGIILCLLIMMLFGFIVMRSLYIALNTRDSFTRLGITGIAMMIGFQSAINMAVNLHLIPPKGMTLPFISYGGSSMVAIALSMGILLSLTRRWPEARLSAFSSSSVLDTNL
ncbi:FtsW/RodA/SpoVE family cell cycle protein [Bartonella doshiae]|uniref:Probable peptidoglycan glycosyltransferase FtsW n=2 Tax=Bartonella doshiae TaxID=33044 RepID=A0A380ZFA4_BARDO|nr:putative peptidoglycan glycosyltransferase FtsW [Bartonella doshiae]EJF81052.1 cell division protein FtsW [Bartonella doshiae NCTC 12862 = ATCC 700133]MBB6159238.1 cell division protein FtsW [Bartonella doshiae]SUV45200.1 Cell division protein FtsW [Bartonella doshiae]